MKSNEEVESFALKPCPFCGGPPVLHQEIHNPDYQRFYVFCHECGAESGGDHELVYDSVEVFEYKKKAIELWNTRDARHSELYEGSRSTVTISKATGKESQ